MEFLSDEWYQAANEALMDLTFKGPDVTIAYISATSAHHISISEGKASVHPGAVGAQITLRQNAEITQELREGSLSALTAIQEGLITVEGDVGSLLASHEALTAIDDILLSVANEN